MSHIFCDKCSTEYNRNYCSKQLSPSVTSISVPRSGSCKRCSALVYGTKFCLGCAIERSLCQGCGKPRRTFLPKSLRQAVVTSRARFDAAKQAAATIYLQTIASFQDEAAQFEAAIASSEQKFESDWAPSQKRHQAAVTKYNQAIQGPNRDDKAIVAANRLSEKTDLQCQKSFSAARKAEQKRNARAKDRFACYDAYRFAVSSRRSNLGMAAAVFSAEVDRELAVYYAQRQHTSALNLAVSINKP